MPEKAREIALRFSMFHLIEEGVLAGIGVLMFFLGMWSSSKTTAVLSYGIGSFSFVVAYFIWRGKRKKKNTLKSSGYSEQLERVDNKKIFDDVKNEGHVRVVEHDAVLKNEPRHEQKNEIAANRNPVERHFERPPISFDIQQRTLTMQQERSERYTASDFIEEEHAIAVSHTEPHNEFHSLVLKILRVIKEMCFAYSVSFFWVNREARQLVVEGTLTDSTSFTPQRKIPIANDLVSRIAMNGQPEMVTKISAEAEKDMLCYYTTLQDVKSFIGVPVFYANEKSTSAPVGIIAIDSKAEDAFGQETFALLTNFTKLLSALLKSYTEKYDLLADSKLLAIDQKVRTAIVGQQSTSVIVNTLLEELSDVVSWDFMAMVLFDSSQSKWIIASARARANETVVVPKQVIDFENSIVGTAIRTNSVQSIADLSKKSMKLFHQNEQHLSEGSCFVVPLAAAGKCYGAVIVGNKKTDASLPRDTLATEYLASTAAVALELIEANALINEHVILDEQSGAYTKKYFLQRLDEELHRATDRAEDLALVLISVSTLEDVRARYSNSGVDATLASVAALLRASIRRYDLVARFDPTTFAVVLIDTAGNDAFLWAEKIRSTIASNVISVQYKNFSVSVTIGICNATDGMQHDECIGRANNILQQALGAGGNMVRVY